MRYLIAVALMLSVACAIGVQQPAQAGVEVGEASFYSWELAGSPTATGEPFDPLGPTVAHPWLPLNSYVTVCYASCAVARVNDRGPYVGGRIVDLSLGTAIAIGLHSDGIGIVSVHY